VAGRVCASRNEADCNIITETMSMGGRTTWAVACHKQCIIETYMINKGLRMYIKILNAATGIHASF
jgi:hypothetical protein